MRDTCLDTVKARLLSCDASCFVKRAILERLVCSKISTVKEHNNM